MFKNSPEALLVSAYLNVMLDRVRSSKGEDRGASIEQTVILVAIFAAGAIAIGIIIVTKFTDKANTIPTGG